MTFQHYVSLGGYCEVAHQIRRRWGTKKAHFFDWLVTPFPGLMKILESDFDGVFLRENLRLDPRTHSVVDAANGLAFHHEFTRNELGHVTDDIIDRKYKVSRAKMQFLIDRWRGVTRGSDPTLYVLVSNEHPDDILRLQALMRGKYPGHDFTLLWARRPGAPGLETEVDGLIQAIVPGAPAGPTEWQGDNAAWDKAFAAVAAIPAAAAT